MNLNWKRLAMICALLVMCGTYVAFVAPVVIPYTNVYLYRDLAILLGLSSLITLASTGVLDYLSAEERALLRHIKIKGISVLTAMELLGLSETDKDNEDRKEEGIETDKSEDNR
jgi:hypothetical protein